MGRLPALRRALQGMETWFAPMGLSNVTLGTSSILVPLMIAHVLGGSVAEVGIQSSAASLAGVVGSVVFGHLADVVSRRRALLLLAIVVLAAGFAALAVARSFVVLLGSATIQSFFWASTGSVSMLLLLHSGERRTWEEKIARLNQVTAFGWLTGLVFGSVALSSAARFTTEEAATRSLFLVLAALAAGSGLLAVRLLPPTPKAAGQGPYVGRPSQEDGRSGPEIPCLPRPSLAGRIRRLLAWELRFPAPLRRLLGETFLTWAGVGFFAVPLPLLLAERFAIPSAHVFLYYVLLDVGVIAAYPLASRWSGRVGNRRVQAIGLLVRLALCLGGGAFLLLSAARPPWILLGTYFLLIGISYSFLQLSGIALASRLAREAERGRVLGAFNAVIGAGMIVAGVGSGYLADVFGYAAPFGAAALLLLLALAVLQGIRDPAPSPGGSPDEAAREDER